MIICDEGKTFFKGTALDLQAELACIIKKFVKDGVIESKEDLEFIVQTAVMSDDELNERAKEMYVELLINEVMSNKEEK